MDFLQLEAYTPPAWAKGLDMVSESKQRSGATQRTGICQPAGRDLTDKPIRTYSRVLGYCYCYWYWYQ